MFEITGLFLFLNLMPRKNSFLLLLIVGVLCCQRATSAVVFSNNLLLAQQKIMQLRIEQARNYTAREYLQNPDNALTHLFDNYCDFVALIISEDAELYKKLILNQNYRLEKVKRSDSRSPYYRFMLAEIHLQWGLVKIKQNNYTEAVMDLRDAYHLLRENKKYFPNFDLNDKSLGLLYVLIGSIPEGYHWLSSLAGLQGNVTEGSAMIKRFANDNSQPAEWILFKKEAGFMDAFLTLWLQKDKTRAFEMIMQNTTEYKSSLLDNYVRASFCMYTGHNDEAISIMNVKPRGNDLIQLHFMDYQLGLAKLYRGDGDADFYLKKFVFTYKGKNYIKECYQKIAWCGLLKGDLKQYQTYIKLAKENGAEKTDEDKQAMREAVSGKIPDTLLLRTRLLFDGGYYQRAYDLISKHNSHEFSQKKDRCEYAYRKGRICEEMAKQEEAIRFFTETISLCKGSSFYFAPNACLHIGYILEKQKNLSAAISYYKKAIEYKGHDYKNSIDQKAKAALKKLEGK